MFMEYLNDVYVLLMQLLEALKVIPLPVYIGAFAILIGAAVVKKAFNTAMTVGSLLLAGYIIWYALQYI